MKMKKPTLLTVAALCVALPTSNLMAAAPSNEELHQMLLNLTNELAATKAENK